MKLARHAFPVRKESDAETGSKMPVPNENYWKPKAIGLLDISKSFAIAFIIATVSVKTSDFFGAENMPGVIQLLLGKQYLILTTLSVLFPLVFPKVAKNISGSEELGTFLIFIFFVMVGLPASIKEVIIKAPLMILFCAIILSFNFIVTFGIGKILKYDLRELVMAAVITSGGPMNGVAIAISKNWRDLVFPSLLLGVWGYIIGNYIGYLMGILLKAIF